MGDDQNERTSENRGGKHKMPIRLWPQWNEINKRTVKRNMNYRSKGRTFSHKITRNIIPNNCTGKVKKQWRKKETEIETKVRGTYCSMSCVLVGHSERRLRAELKQTRWKYRLFRVGGNGRANWRWWVSWAALWYSLSAFLRPVFDGHCSKFHEEREQPLFRFPSPGPRNAVHDPK